ncbi:hypothetical protein Tco_1201543 [Tanacetum coccineum]
MCTSDLVTCAVTVFNFQGKTAQDRMLVWKEADSRNFDKKDSFGNSLFKTCSNELGGGEKFNPTHAYYNGSRTSKDNEDPSWNTRTFHKVVRLGINPMIQPEPEDLPKDNPKLEIAVLRWQSAPASEY